MYRSVCIDNLCAIVLGVVAALIARSVTAEAGVGLCANADNVTDLDASLGLGTDADGYTNDFVSDNARIGSLTL